MVSLLTHICVTRRQWINGPLSGEPPITGGFLSQRANMWNLNVLFVVSINTMFSCLWSKMPYYSCERTVIEFTTSWERLLWLAQRNQHADPTPIILISLFPFLWPRASRLGQQAITFHWYTLHYSHVTWVPWHLKLPSIQLFVQQVVHPNNKANVEVLHQWPLVRGGRWWQVDSSCYDFITWTNVDPNHCRHMRSPGHNELTKMCDATGPHQETLSWTTACHLFSSKPSSEPMLMYH